MASSTSPTPVQRFDGFEVDPRARELRRKGVRIRIQDQPLEVLLLLLERNGEVVTREELKQRLWPAGTYVDAEDGLNTAIRKLREHLGDSAERPTYIETIPRRGYRFIGNVEQPAGAPSNPVEAMPEPPAAPASTAPEAPKHRTPWRSIAIAMSLLALISASAWIALRHRHQTTQPQATISSIAVLPLANLSGDPAQDYFAEGITEEVIGRLSMIRGLRVISRTSSMQFKDTHMTAPEIARALNVDALVEGSVIREGNRVRVHAQLIRAATDEHFWSETYDREMRDALALESDIAQSIAQKVEVTVTGEERARLVAARSVSPEVYDSYLKGRRMLESSRSKPDLEKSVAFFEEAIHKDPAFAPAYVGLAYAYNALGTIVIGVPASETRPKVVENAQKAIELDPNLAEAHVRLADVYRLLWRWSDSEVEMNRALALNPNDVDVQRLYADWLLVHGRTEEALAWARRARALDPLGSGTQLIEILFDARQYDEAFREARSNVDLAPDNVRSLLQLSVILIAMGRAAEAIPYLEKSVALTNRSPGAVEFLAVANARAGRREEALRLRGELLRRRKTGYVPAGAFVLSAIALGDRDQAFVWLNRACDEKSNITQFIKVHPFLDPIRDDPRFAELVHRVGLDQ